MDLGDLGESPSKFTLVMRWLFDQFILPLIEWAFPCKHPDDETPAEPRKG
jgi:hypothetical protein